MDPLNSAPALKMIFVHPCSVLCLVIQLCQTLCDPMHWSPPDSSVHGDSPGKNTRMGCHALLQGVFPAQGLNPDVPHCWRFCTIWITRERKNIGVGSLYLLQGIFLTQDSDWGLLHCRQILYQLSYQGIVHPYATIIAKYLENHPWTNKKVSISWSPEILKNSIRPFYGFPLFVIQVSYTPLSKNPLLILCFVFPHC